MSWKRVGASWAEYKFGYDRAGRLTGSEGINNGYREYDINYDRNGNLTNLKRHDGSSEWDTLSYDYNNSGNRLNAIIDYSGNNNGVKAGTYGYSYDSNGNMTNDGQRGASVNYNILNLPRQVSVNGQTVSYHYDGTGNKLRMANTNNTVHTRYAGIFEYNEQNYLTRIATEEGQIVVTNSGHDFALNYYLKDHLGNVRMVLNANAGILQETEYYPFGLAIPRDTPPKTQAERDIANKYLFNGIEKQPETGIYLARFRGLDPTIGRWMQIDPKPDQSMSLYAAMNNNPIRNVDPLGDTTIVNNRGVILKQYGGNNIIYQQGRKGKLTQIGEFGKSINLNGIMGNVLRDNRRTARSLSIKGFYSHVKAGGTWDYKDSKMQAGNIFGAAAKFDEQNNSKTGFSFQSYKFKDGSDIGNFNYGYVGRNVGGDGYSPLVLWHAAGAAQIKKDFFNAFEFIKGFQELGTFLPSAIGIRPPVGDENDDFGWTTLGMVHADNEKENN